MNFETGKTYGNYEIIDVLSSSRDGVTYKVRNTLVNRLEAMKVLPGNSQNDLEAVERFLREVRVHAGMQHPNIVAFYNATELEGRLVMTHELAEGVTLAGRLELGPLPWKEAISCMAQVLAALAYAHARNVVHRDLTPARIALTPEGAARLNGFSLAKGLAEAHLTVVGAVVGSLKYISPEQVKGVEGVDARSDIYSAGVVLYEALAGRPPFDAKSQFELMAAHVNATPEPPSTLQPSVPKELDAIVLKALAKDPAARFQTAAGFRQALDAVGIQTTEPVQPAEASAPAAVPGPQSSPAAGPAQDATRTPELVSAVGAAPTPQSTSAPEAVPTPEAAAAPEATLTTPYAPTPAATSTEATTTPEATATPEAAAAPEAAPIPPSAPTPAATPAEATTTPEATAAPPSAAAPGDTATPEAAPAPEAASTPPSAPALGATRTEAITASEATAAPEDTAMPEAAAAPEAALTPPSAPAPGATPTEAIAAPEATAAPDTAAAPDPPPPPPPLPPVSAKPPASSMSPLPLDIPLSAPVFAPPSAAPLPRELMLAGFFLFLVGVAAFFAFR